MDTIQPDTSAVSEAIAAGAAAAEPQNEEKGDEKEFQVMVYNVGKRSNVGNIIRSAVAFGCKTMIGTFDQGSLRWSNASILLCIPQKTPS